MIKTYYNKQNKLILFDQVGLRRVEQARVRMRDAVARDPMRPGSLIYEEINGQMKAELQGADREEFIQLLPSYRSFERSFSR